MCAEYRKHTAFKIQIESRRSVVCMYVGHVVDKQTFDMMTLYLYFISDGTFPFFLSILFFASANFFSSRNALRAPQTYMIVFYLVISCSNISYSKIVIFILWRPIRIQHLAFCRQNLERKNRTRPFHFRNLNERTLICNKMIYASKNCIKLSELSQLNCEFRMRMCWILPR